MASLPPGLSSQRSNSASSLTALGLAASASIEQVICFRRTYEMQGPPCERARKIRKRGGGDTERVDNMIFVRPGEERRAERLRQPRSGWDGGKPLARNDQSGTAPVPLGLARLLGRSCARVIRRIKEGKRELDKATDGCSAVEQRRRGEGRCCQTDPRDDRQMTRREW